MSLEPSKMLTNTHTAFVHEDGAEYDPTQFIYLEGPCKKCKTSNNSLIILQYKANAEDVGESLFKTTCISCGALNIYYRKNVEVKRDE